jgi:hypothetical protein
MAMNTAAVNYLADLMTGLGTGFLSAPRGGPPLAGLGAGIQNANALMGQRQQQAVQSQELQWRADQVKRQQDADAEAARQKQAAKLWLIGQQPPVSSSDSAATRLPAQAGAIASLPAAHQSFYQGYASIDPLAAAQMAGQEMLKAPDTSAPTTRDFNEGGNVVTKQWDPNSKSWVALSTAPRWQPAQPPQMPADYRIYLEDRKAHPEIKEFATYRGWQTYNPSATTKTPNIVTLYGPKGEIKSAYENDPGIPGMLQNGWTATAPKASVTYQTLTGDALKAVNPNLDATKTWKIGSDGSAVVVDKPERAAGGIITGNDAAKLNLDPTGVYQVRPDGSYAVLQKPRAEGTYGGQGIEAQDSNIILKGQDDDAFRATPEYALAWNRLYEQPKWQMLPDPTNPNNQILTPIPPVVPAGLKPPARSGDSGQAAPGAPAIGAAQGTPLAAPPAAAPGAGPAAAPRAPAPSGYRYSASGNLEPVPGGPADPNTATPEQRNKVNEKLAGLDRLQAALDNYKNLIAPPPGAKDANGNPIVPVKPGIVGSVLGLPTDSASQLGTAYTALAIEAKNLFELGALSGPDYGLIQQTLKDPNTTGGYLQDNAGRLAQIEEVQKILNNSRKSYEQNYGPAMRTGPAPSPKPSIDDLKKKFNITPVNP